MTWRSDLPPAGAGGRVLGAPSSEGNVRGSYSGSASAARGGRVLILDDDLPTRDMLTLALQSSGYQVSEAVTGLRLVSHLEVDPPDVILLETQLGWVDGVALCRALKANPAFEHIPVLFISDRRRPEDVIRGLAAGAVDYLPKPLDLGRLMGRMREVLEVESWTT